MEQLEMLRLGVFGAAVALSLPALLMLQWLRARGLHPLRSLARRLRVRRLGDALIVACMTFGAVRYAATKEGGDSGGDPPEQLRSMPYAPTVAPAAVDPLEMNFPTNFPPVTNLCFWGIERGSNSVLLGIAWPSSLVFTNDLVDLYGNWLLASNGWGRLLQVDVGAAVSNAVVDVPFALFPTNAMETAAFFRLASQDDSDGDGLTDAYESWSLGTDPTVPDTDGDALPDGNELSLGTDPFAADTDGDGLSDGEEVVLGTSPLQPDTDGDGMDDGWEVENGLDPLSTAGDDGPAGDPDADGVDNVTEFRLRTDPQSVDTDADGLADGEEAAYCSSVAPAQMFNLHVLADLTEAMRSSPDGIVSCGLLVPVVVQGEAVTNITVDVRGIVYFNRPGYANPGVPHAAGRLDGSVLDGNCFAVSAYGGELALSESSSVCVCAAVVEGVSYAAVEYSNMTCGTNTISFLVATRTGDSDRAHVWYTGVLGDGVDGRNASVGFQTFGGRDRVSYFYHEGGRLLDGLGLTFRVGLGTDPADADTDGDGLLDGEEVDALGTNPSSADTDGDGRSDDYELLNGTDPTSYTDGTGMSSSYPYRGLNFDIYGDYAAWSMTIEGLGPIDYRCETFSMESPGYANGRLKALRKGNSYRLSMSWLNSDGHENPYWYCWQAKINGLPATPSYESYTSNRLEGNEIVHGTGWMAENASGLLTSHVHTHDGAGGNVAGSLQSVLHVYQYDVSICSPDDDAWGELDASRVLLDDESLRIRVRIAPAIATLDLCRLVMGSNICVKTSGTCPTGAEIPIEAADFSVYADHSEIRMTKTFAQLKSLGLLPQSDEDGVDEMAWMDVPETAGQDLSDSTAFSALGYAFRGKAIAALGSDLDADPPISQRSTSFMKAAGCEIVSATYGGMISGRRQIMNQADYFYFSGHGSHKTGAIQGGFTPSDAQGRWNRDVNVGVIAGCAVLDVGNYRLKSTGYFYRLKHRKWFGEKPGEVWESVGAKYLLGYALKAPLDSDGGTEIANSFIANVKNGQTVVIAWKNANDVPKGRNACAIDCSSSPHVFWYWDESSGVPVWTNKTQGATSWPSE